MSKYSILHLYNYKEHCIVCQPLITARLSIPLEYKEHCITVCKFMIIPLRSLSRPPQGESGCPHQRACNLEKAALKKRSNVTTYVYSVYYSKRLTSMLFVWTTVDWAWDLGAGRDRAKYEKHPRSRSHMRRSFRSLWSTDHYSAYVRRPGLGGSPP